MALNKARMSSLSDKLDEAAAQAEAEREKLEATDEKRAKIIKKSAKKD